MVLVTAAVEIDFEALLKVIGASLALGVGVTIAFSLALYGATVVAERRREGRPGSALPFALLTAAGLSVSLAAVVVGLIVMTQK